MIKVKSRLYTHGEHRVFPNKMAWLKKDNWYLTDKEKPAHEYQQKFLKYLGWGIDKLLTQRGASTIIDSILNA